MKSVLSSFWFWLFIIGIALILTAALIGGGMKKVTGWTWAIFIVGAVLAILGVIFAFVAIRNSTPCVEESEEASCPNLYSSNGSSGCPLNKKEASSLSSPRVTSPISPRATSSSSPLLNSSLPNSPVSSPLGTPTLVTSNIPQAQRGFATTSLNLSALAPNT